MFLIFFLPVAFFGGLLLAYVPERGVKYPLLGLFAVLPLAYLAFEYLTSGCLVDNPTPGCGQGFAIAAFVAIFYVPTWIALVLAGFGAAWLIRRFSGGR